MRQVAHVVGGALAMTGFFLLSPVIAAEPAAAKADAPPSASPPPGYAAGAVQQGASPPPGYAAGAYAAGAYTPGFYPPGAYPADGAYDQPARGYPYQAVPPFVRRPPPPGRHTHDGVFFRLVSGLTRLSMSVSDGPNKGTLSGGGLNLGVAVGGAITENLILYAEGYILAIADPERTNSMGSDTLTAVEMMGVGVGPGLAYYLEPLNAYLSLTVGFAKVALQDTATHTDEGSTQWGYGLSTLLGKEFWVSDNWGLGLALQFHYASMADGTPGAGPLGHAHSQAFSALFSCSFN